MIIADTSTGPVVVDPADLDLWALLIFSSDPECLAELLRRLDRL